MSTPSSPSTGLAVIHLFARIGPLADHGAVLAAVDRARARGDQVVTASMLGHRADVAMMALSTDQWNLRSLQTELGGAGLEIVDSYVSLTEISEYASGVPEEMRNTRLYPQLPPPDKPAFCFYPMSKKREGADNWYTEDFERRKEMMYEHGGSGRKFAGRVLQVITGSTGLDDYEWGVTLFAVNPDDIKEVVYTMRFDEASARFGIFGPFYVGMVASTGAVLEAAGCHPGS